ncbi:MAG: hypothetical protein WBB23_09315 [Desulforhopalus sp.]
MVRVWYCNRQQEQRLLSIEEIAGACCIDKNKVQEWLVGNHLRRARPGEDLLDAAEVVSFLIRHNIPVSPWLLPAKTEKILFIAPNESEFQDQEDKFDLICRFFADSSNILVETAIAGNYADLSILTFSPNVVVIFVREFDEHTSNTLNVLSSIPERKTILVLDDLIMKEMNGGLIAIPANLIVSDTLPLEQLHSQLCSVFVNRYEEKRPLSIS